MSKPLNVAVIGCGYWGPNLIRNFISINECQVSLICDASPDRLSHMQKLYPSVQTTTRADDIFENDEIDAVTIATPVGTHFNLARKALEAGKHAFVEKPMATSVEESETLVELAEQNNLTLMVGHTFIYTPAVRYMRKLIREGTLGQIYSINSSRLNLGLFQNDINVVWDLAPHDLSIILYLLEMEPLYVNCVGQAHFEGIKEDVATLSMEFPNSIFVNIQSSWLDPNKIRKMTLVGSKGMVVYDDIEPNEKIKIYDKRVEAPPYYDTFAEFQYSYHYGDMYAPYLKMTEPLKVECQHFIDCINTGSQCLSGGKEGLEVVQILEASSQSLKNGGAKVAVSE